VGVLTDKNKIFQLRAVWSVDGRLTYNMQRTSVSPQEALGLFDMAKHQILHEIKKSSEFETEGNVN